MGIERERIGEIVVLKPAERLVVYERGDAGNRVRMRVKR